MPTYQYVCTECGGQIEAVQKFTDEALTTHDECGGRLRKVYSAVGIVFKGSGFYRTDSRASSASATSSSASSSDGGSSSASSSADSAAPKSGGESAASTASSAASSGSSSGEKVA